MQWKNIKKLGLCVMAFEGSEHLQNILSEIRDLVDIIIIGYQETSYHGDMIDQSDAKTLVSLEKLGLVDFYYHTVLDTKKEPRKQETDKRNKLVEFAEQHGCSHVLIIDADEFYTHDSFYNALKEIDENDYEITYCQYVNYYHDYKHYLIYPFPDGMYVPFVSKTKYRFNFETNDFPHPSDPTRRYVIPNDPATKRKVAEYHIFPWDTIKMHHLSWLRVNIRKKLKAWSSKKCFTNQELLIDKAVYDFEHFDDIIKQDNQKVHLVFNTPGNQLNVAEFDKQYIHPKYDFHDCYKKAEHPKNILILNLSSTASDGLYQELEQACRDTWVKQIEQYDYLQYNVKYFSVIDGKEDKIDFENKVVYIKDKEGISNLNNLLYRYVQAVNLLKNSSEFDYNIEYIVRTNTSTWLNIPVIEKIIANEDDESLIYGYSFQSAFWSQYNVYLNGQLIIMSMRQFNILKETCEQNKYFDINTEGVLDDILIGNAFTHRCILMGIKQMNYFRNLYCEIDDLDVCVAKQCKSLKDHNNIEKRREHDIALMHEYNNKIKIDVDQAYEHFLNHKNELIVNIIPYTRTEWIFGNVDEETKLFCRNKFIKSYKDINELYKYINELKAIAGYKIY